MQRQLLEAETRIYFNRGKRRNTPQFVLCIEVIAHSSLKEPKLRRHLELKHVKCVDDNFRFLKIKKHHVKQGWGTYLLSRAS